MPAGRAFISFPITTPNHGFREWLVSLGESEESIGRHRIPRRFWSSPRTRSDASNERPRGGFERSGVSGNSTRASAACGEEGIDLKVEATLRRLKELTALR